MGLLGPPWISVTSAPANPGAGAIYTWTVPAGQLWHPLSIRWTLASSATVATRTCSLYFVDVNGHGYAQAGFNLNQAASQTVFYAAYLGAALMGGTVGGLITMPLPDLIMSAGEQMQLFVNNLQAGDQEASIALLYEYLSYG